MKNLLNKIGKALLVPTLALSLGVQKSNAQEDNYPKIEFNPGVSVGWDISKYSGPKVYDNWQEHFEDLTGNERLEEGKTYKKVNCEFGTDLGILFKNGFSFGLNTKYSLTENSKMSKNYLCKTELHNWEFDYANINEVFLRQKTPSLGAYLKFPISEDIKLVLRSSIRNAELNEVKREDKNLKDIDIRLKCEPSPVDDTKGLTRIFEEKKSNVLLNRNGAEFQFYNEGAICGMEVFYETDWNKIHQAGFSLNFSLDNLYK